MKTIEQTIQLRWLVTEKQEPISSSWCSSDKLVTISRSTPVLQYSTDGVKWLDVPTVIEKVQS